MKKNILVVSILCMAATLWANTGLWDGTVATALPQQAGTAEDPILITSGAELALLAQECNSGAAGANTLHFEGKYFRLDNDIDLNNHEWIPIGWHVANANRSSFAGHFDGNGHTISKLLITAPKKIASAGTANTNFYGLFGAVNGGSIKNLTVTGAITDLAVQNAWIAGITGRASSTVINNCINRVNITDTKTQRTTANTIGGIVGYSDGTTVISETANHGDITIDMSGTGSAKYNRHVGGLIGQGGTSVTVNTCYNKGNIKLYGKRTAGTWNMYVGSLAGECKSVDNCFNIGTVSMPDSTLNSMTDNSFGVVMGKGVVTGVYCLDTAVKGTPTVENSVQLMTADEMKAETFFSLLGSSFKQGEDGFPILSFEVTDLPEEPEVLVEPWDGTIAKSLPVTPDNDGSSADKPILISYSAQLALIAKRVDEGEPYTGKYFRLTNDLDLNNMEWTPIGWHISNSNKAWFEGHFDGAGYTVKNLSIAKTHYIHYASTGSNITFYGLFGAVAKGSISNLTVEGTIGNIANTAFAAGITGRAQETVVSRCVSKVDIDATATNNGGVISAAGIVAATVTSATIKECINKGNITADMTTTTKTTKGIGAFIGTGTSGTIEDCYNAAQITIKGVSDDLTLQVGALAGGYKAISNSYSWGTVTVDAKVATLHFGPVAGLVNDNGNITNAYYLHNSILGATSNDIGLQKTDEELKAVEMITLLNTDAMLWTTDNSKDNNGYPRLSWEPDNESELTAVNSPEITTEAVKYMRNGQLFILKDGCTYNVLGQIVNE